MKNQLSLLTAAALALTAALAPAEEAKADVKVTITGNDQMQYDVKTFNAMEGQTVELTFKNIGVLPVEAMGHNVVILKLGTEVPQFAMAGVANREGGFLPTDKAMKDKIIANTKILGPGQSETITFTAPGPGTYDYICTFPGHFGVMRGTMVVKAK